MHWRFVRSFAKSNVSNKKNLPKRKRKVSMSNVRDTSKFPGTFPRSFSSSTQWRRQTIKHLVLRITNASLPPMSLTTEMNECDCYVLRHSSHQAIPTEEEEDKKIKKRFEIKETFISPVGNFSSLRSACVNSNEKFFWL
jgi:hypothetical protein